jgi:hypothetical protein
MRGALFTVVASQQATIQNRELCAFLSPCAASDLESNLYGKTEGQQLVQRVPPPFASECVQAQAARHCTYTYKSAHALREDKLDLIAFRALDLYPSNSHTAVFLEMTMSHQPVNKRGEGNLGPNVATT